MIPKRITGGIPLLIACIIAGLTGTAQAQTRPMSATIDQIQPRMVKIFGGGGFQRLESWQSGFFISDDGFVATVWSYVLDAETSVVLDDGRRLTAKLVGYHPQYEIALLKVDVQDQPSFSRETSGLPASGESVLAFSNLYGVANGNEKCSVQSGIVSAVTRLNARRGVQKIAYDGPVILVDAIINNPGAAGGAVTDNNGKLLGLIGRESRSVESGLWLNYAMPAESLWVAIDQIRSGQTATRGTPGLPTEFLTTDLMGLVMVPNVVDRTPPFVDQVIADSAAELAGIQPDDLIIEAGGKLVISRKDLNEKLREIDRDASIELVIQRGDEFLTLELKVR